MPRGLQSPESEFASGLAKAEEIARSQLGYWRDMKRKHGNYAVLCAMSECRRVAQAIKAFRIEYEETGCRDF